MGYEIEGSKEKGWRLKEKRFKASFNLRDDRITACKPKQTIGGDIVWEHFTG
jgi:hypothetical protein